MPSIGSITTPSLMPISAPLSHREGHLAISGRSPQDPVSLKAGNLLAEMGQCMDSLFVVIGVMGLICAVTVVLRVRTIGWGVWIWFFSGWITGEAAVWVMGSQLGFVALWVLLVGTDSAGFGFGLSAFLGAWALLAWALRDAFDAGAVFQRA